MDVKEILAEFKKDIKKLYGNRLSKVILYGSWARGTATKESDIDLLVVLKTITSPGKEIDHMINMITEINLKYNVLLSVYPISEKDYLTLHTPLLINVQREGVPA